MNQKFYPNREGDQLTWFTNIEGKIASYYDTLEITAGRQAKIELVLRYLIWLWGTFMPSRRRDSTTATTYRNSVATGKGDPSVELSPPAPAALTPVVGVPFFGMLTWLFEEIARWKAAEGCTDTIADDLGIRGAAPVVHNEAPGATTKVKGENNIELGFVLHEHDGVLIQSMVQGDTAFANLATDTASPYNDTRPVKNKGQAEWRDYRLCWMDHDVPTLDFGPVVRALVQG